VFDEISIRQAISLDDGPLVKEMIGIIEDAFIQYAAGNVEVAPVQHLGFEKRASGGGGGDFCVKSGYILNDDVFVVKVAGGGFDGMNTSSGSLQVFSQVTGKLEGLLVDNGYLTDVRTAIAGGIYAKHFAPSEVTAIGLMGTGVQAIFQLQVLSHITACRKVVLYGRTELNREKCKKKIEAMGFTVIKDSNIAVDVVENCNLIVTVSSARSPIIREDDCNKLKSHTLIIAMGADGIGKQEVDVALFRGGEVSLVVADSKKQCVAFGELSHPVSQGLLNEESVVELGQYLKTPEKFKKSRTGKQLVIADSTGVAVQDVAIAKFCLKRMKHLE